MENSLISLLILVILFSSNNPSLATARKATLLATTNEASALMKWKSSLDKQSQSILKSWVGSDPCQDWVGIGCNNGTKSFVTSIKLNNTSLKGTLGDLQTWSLDSLQNLEYLDLSFNSLSGIIPSNFGNLSKLKYLDLSVNNFSSMIPAEIGLLRSLDVLNLGNNTLFGHIPSSIGNLTNLTRLNLTSNHLTGPIPPEIGSCLKITNLDLSNNQLTRVIPSSIGNLTNLYFIYLYGNRLSGSIPPEVGRARDLKHLILSRNQLSGSIPTSFRNFSRIERLQIDDNHITGSIPNYFANYTNLEMLDLHVNNFSGFIPPDLGKRTALVSLSLCMNNFNGFLPRDMNLSKMEHFSVSRNNLSGHLPNDICVSGVLILFSVRDNHFSGPIPKSLKNCTSLSRVRLEGNKLTGNISEDFGIYPDLVYFDLSDNEMYGEMSSNWGFSPNLTLLYLSNNNISGTISIDLGRATRLVELKLSSNKLVGEIPTSFGKLSSLSKLHLDNNKLSGTVPSELGNLYNLEEFNVARNSLGGRIQENLGDCFKLRNLNLSSNRFEGVIPLDISKLQHLETLDLSGNNLVGKLPAQLGSLKIVQTLNISHNNFTGLIPSSFTEMLSLTTIDISFNQLEGPIPEIRAFEEAPMESLRNNNMLCGNNTGLHKCPVETRNQSSKKTVSVMILVLLPTFGCVFLMFCIGVVFFRLMKRKQNDSDSPQVIDANPFSIWSYDGKLVYESIIEALDDFNSKFIVGIGGFGTVYKAELLTGVVAVKKFHPPEEGETQNLKSFENEIRALTEIRHQNIVKLYGFCSHSRHSFLVYEFLAGGSLRKVLNDKDLAVRFGWEKRVMAVRDIANALSYMHHDCLQPIIHRDLSSGNVLFDLDWVAHVSDFGTARLLKPDSSNWTAFAGTFGYVAPEVVYTMEVSEKGDVYSFGVLTLEVIMGKHPGDFLTSSPETTKISLTEILDPRLPSPVEKIVKELKLIVDVAISCLNKNPNCRPSMREVALGSLVETTSSSEGFSTISNLNLEEDCFLRS